jgi:hypothetical protein
MYDGSLRFDTKVDADGFNKGIGGIKSGLSNLTGIIGKFAALAGVAFSVVALRNFLSTSKELYKTQLQNEQRLARVMRNTIGATDEQIQSVLDLTKAHQEFGIISDNIQLAGAQELGTYVTQTESLKELIPVMNDMLVQQYGFEASGENAINIATMLGKVLDGQVGALLRYGYSFTDAQERILKYGSETERVKTIVDVISASVGGMNSALAQTDIGRQIQLKNAMNDVREQFGKAATQIQILFLPVIQAVARGLATVANYARQVAQLLAEVFGSKD